jgi:CBS domain-containing protein
MSSRSNRVRLWKPRLQNWQSTGSVLWSCWADRRVIGILSERDIVREFAELGADALTKRLAQAMTREIATCGEAETAVSIMERMTTGKFRHIPVVEKDRLVGIVSIGDIVKHRLWEMEQESAALRDYIQSA